MTGAKSGGGMARRDVAGERGDSPAGGGSRRGSSRREHSATLLNRAHLERPGGGRITARRLLALAFCVVALGLSGFATPDADAGTYVVHVCDAETGYRVNAVSFWTSSPQMPAYQVCPNDGGGHRIGMEVQSGIGVGTVGAFSVATATFDAPAATSIRSFDMHMSGYGRNGFGSSFGSSSDHFASNQTLLVKCDVTCPWTGVGGTPMHFDVPGANALRLGLVCGSWGGCSTTSTGEWPYAPGWGSIGDMQIVIDDPVGPALANGRGAAWNGGAWHRGTEGIGFDASDNTGIQRMRVEVSSGSNAGSINPGSPIDQGHPCDYTYAVPCANRGLGSEIDTRNYGDGMHVIRLAAEDAAGNWSSVDAPLNVDNGSPGRPGAVTVAGGESNWHTTNAFDISWNNPGGQTAPINRVHYTIYDSDGNAVSSSAPSGSGINSLSGVTVPGVGDYTLKLYLEDAAGNASPETASDPVHLKFDNVAPAQASPQHRNGWVGKTEASSYLQHIFRPLASSVPVSGIAGYAFSTDGSEPGLTSQVGADQGNGYQADAPVGNLSEGATTFKARAISGAGVAAPDVGVETIHTDLTAPVLQMDGMPNPNEWSREAVSLKLTATDPGQLSGMAGAEALDSRDEDGGYIGYTIGGASKRNIRGPAQPQDPTTGLRAHEPSAEASIPIGDDGPHTLTYSATDVAGNETAEKTLSVKIDRTPPELVVVEAQQQADPRLITVAASDRTSGLADGGTVQLRRIGPSQGDWVTLRTAREGQHYYAHVDNSQLPSGDYQFRAVIPDQAGNRSTGDRSRSGQLEVLHIDPTHVGPYRTDLGNPTAGNGTVAADAGATVGTRLTARAVSRVKKSPAKKCKTVTRKGRKHKKCAKVKIRTVERLVPIVRVAFGKKQVTRGTLTTAAGQPIGEAEITVLAKVSADGAQYRAEGSTRTDRAGRFTYTARAGASRTLDFSYRGNSTFKHAGGSVVLKVPASATMKSDRKRTRNGSSVGFRGKLLGVPYPSKGKVLDLQAHYRGKWRTFATPRAKLNGGWKYRYRFGATRGHVVYKFRVRVRPSSDYPYELGYSKLITVSVTGR